MHNPFRYFNSSPEVIRSAVMLYVRYPLSLRQVEDILFERGIDICHETVRYWWNRFGPLFAAEIRKRRIHRGGIVTLLNGRAANWHRTQAQAAAVTVCHRPIAWLRNWRNVFRDIRWRWTLKVL